jgi:hypothetical protein
MTYEDTPLRIALSLSPDAAGTVKNSDFVLKSGDAILAPASSLVVTGTGANRTLTYTPPADRNGLTTVTVSLTSGGASYSWTFALQVQAVNDPPSFAGGGNVLSHASLGTITMDNWAYRISEGPWESGQALTFEVQQEGGPATVAPPTVSATGALSFNTNVPKGTYTFRVRLHDDGGTANGGSDTSAWQTFTIILN